MFWSSIHLVKGNVCVFCILFLKVACEHLNPIGKINVYIKHLL